MDAGVAALMGNVNLAFVLCSKRLDDNDRSPLRWIPRHCCITRIFLQLLQPDISIAGLLSNTLQGLDDVLLDRTATVTNAVAALQFERIYPDQVL